MSRLGNINNRPTANPNTQDTSSIHKSNINITLQIYFPFASCNVLAGQLSPIITNLGPPLLTPKALSIVTSVSRHINTRSKVNQCPIRKTYFITPMTGECRYMSPFRGTGTGVCVVVGTPKIPYKKIPFDNVNAPIKTRPATSLSLLFSMPTSNNCAL